MSPNLAASIKARLRNRANSEDFNLVLVRYACERFLYRLGESSVRDRCILKGASLLSVWMDDPYRSTRDIDLSADGASHETAIREIIAATCSVDCAQDGLTFDLASIRVSPIQEQGPYPGQRVKLCAYIDRTRIPIQVDFGFGDAVTPEPQEIRMRTLLDGMPQPVLRAYSPLTTIAEKFETMVRWGTSNSRMKDFYDLWGLSEILEIDGTLLLHAISECFERRGTDWTSERPAALTTAFYFNAKLQGRWRGYLSSGSLLAVPPESFDIVGERIQEFLVPLQDCVLRDGLFDMHWPAGGPWQPRGLGGTVQ